MSHYLSSVQMFRNLIIVTSAWALAGCVAINTGSHYDETANFSAYKTFSWVSDQPYVYDETSIRISPLTQNKIRVAIRNRLEKSGYAFTDTPGSADLLVAYTVGTRDKIRVESYPVEYSGSWGWHVHGSHYYVREVSEHSYTEGTLGVDIFDGHSNKPIWHGWAEKTISDSDRKDPGPIIEEGVTRLFDSFPR